MDISDRELLEVLTQRVRVLSTAQAGEIYKFRNACGLVSVLRRLKRLEKDGLIEFGVGLANPEPPLLVPTITWSKGHSLPDFGSASYQLRKRWVVAPRPTKHVIASSAAGSYFGGSGGRFPRPSELTHDLCLAKVFLRFRSAHPDRARRWLSESTLYEQGEGRSDRLPDALIVSRSGKTVIEFGGSYTAPKLRAFHYFCVDRGWNYEVW